MTIQTQFPTGDNSTTWTASGGGSRYVEVDESPVDSHDSDTTYVYRQTSNAYQEFSFPAFTINSTSVNSISVSQYTRRTATGTNNTNCRIQVDTTEYVGTNGNNTDSYQKFTITWLTNPKTGIAWTEAQVENRDTGNNLNAFGPSAAGTGAGEEHRCTQTWIECDYVAAGGGNIGFKLAGKAARLAGIGGLAG